MKKVALVLLAVGLLGVVQCAQAAEVSSVNVVGFYKVTVPGKGMALCSLQLDSIDPANQNLLGVLGTNQLFKSNISTAADKVLLWDTGIQKWVQYYQKADGNFALVAGGVVTNPPLFSGSGFFITRQGATDLSVTFTGEALQDPVVTNTIVPGLQPTAYPFSSATGLADMNLGKVGFPSTISTSADKVTVWDTATTNYVQYFLRTSTPVAWHKVAGGAGPFNPTIELGQGFWYSRNTAKPAFEWAETNKYLGNL